VQKNWAARAKQVRKIETWHKPAERPREPWVVGAPRLAEAATPEKVERRPASRGAKAAVGLQPQAASIPVSLPQWAERPSEEPRREE
jgi:hypothetical protein